MVKSSTELIAMARDIVERELQRSIDKGKQPSFYECCYEAYLVGQAEVSGVPAETIKKAQDWHYIELEGVPDNDDQHAILYEYDGKYKDVTMGYYESGRWHLDYHPSYCDYKVIAWHKIPLVPQT